MTRADPARGGQIMSMVPGSAAPQAAPILIGVLYDFPQADGGASVEEAIHLGLGEVMATGRIDRAVELLPRQARGLPGGTAHDVEKCYQELVDQGVLAVVGPSISDNGLIVGPLADRARLPTINYTGGEMTRGEFMFHYQVGSLQEEPVVLVEHLVRQGISSLAAAYDNSPVGRGYADSLAEACATAGIDITGSAAISPLAEDVSPTIRRLRASDPESLVYLGLGVAARAVALAVEAEDWKLPIVANSSLMFGYTRRDWRAGWEGWVYVDGVSDQNTERARLAEHAPKTARGPVGVAAYDIGRLLGEAIARSAHLTRNGIKEGLERVKRLPAATGLEGTTMGFGHWDHGALKGRYLVLRSWRDGKSVQVQNQ
jgi:ABC-type branched-subunit amino acid transport system substrate-binding protein